MLKCAVARFEIIESTRDGGEPCKYVVTFDGDEVIVAWLNKRKVIKNAPQNWGGRRLKPRMSDAFYAVREAQVKPKIEPKSLSVVR